MSEQDSHINLISTNSICSCIEFSGDNGIDFLNNLLISDLKVLDTNKFHYSALCNPKGRIIASLWINIKDKDLIQVICPSNMLDLLLTFFNMRKFRLKLDIAEIEYNTIIDDSQQQNNNNGFYERLFSMNLPWIDAINTEKFIPQHVNLDQHEDIMSFKKGCYPGQEIIARLKFIGKIKKRMRVVESDDRETLKDRLNSHNQVSPIIRQFDGKYSVQIIDTII